MDFRKHARSHLVSKMAVTAKVAAVTSSWSSFAVLNTWEDNRSCRWEVTQLSYIPKWLCGLLCLCERIPWIMVWAWTQLRMTLTPDPASISSVLRLVGCTTMLTPTCRVSGTLTVSSCVMEVENVWTWERINWIGFHNRPVTVSKTKNRSRSQCELM